MKKVIFFFLTFLILTTQTKLLATANDDAETYQQGIARVAAVSTAAYVGSWLGEKWAVDITTRMISQHIQSANPLFDFLIAGAVRGRSHIEAVPIAANYGAFYGAVGVTIAAPLLWDCKESLVSSSKRIYNQDVKDPATWWDYGAVGSTAIGAILLAWAALK